jgi:hypothetical protein
MFLKGIRKLLSGRKVIMAINQLQYLRYADEIIEVSNGIARNSSEAVKAIAPKQSSAETKIATKEGGITSEDAAAKTEYACLFSFPSDKSTSTQTRTCERTTGSTSKQWGLKCSFSSLLRHCSLRP